MLRKTSQASPRPRLNAAEVRRLATVFERDTLALGTAGSGVTLAAAALVALLMAAVAWSPFLSGNTHEVEMPPVVAGAPPPPVTPSLSPSGAVAPLEFRQGDLGEIFRSMLYELGPSRALEAETESDPE